MFDDCVGHNRKGTQPHGDRPTKCLLLKSILILKDIWYPHEVLNLPIMANIFMENTKSTALSTF